MELYIEREFLDNFYLDYPANPSDAQIILRTIFKEYGDKRTYMNYSVQSPDELASLKAENPFFSELSIHFPPIEINDIEAHFFSNSNCTQTLIFTKEHKEWFESAENQGALCGSFENYESRIESFIKKTHFRIDLSEPFGGWSIFHFENLVPLNFIKLNDNYILTDKRQQRIDDNLVPILKNLINSRNTTDIEILSKDFNPEGQGSIEQIKEAALKRHRKLNSALANFNKSIRLVQNDLVRDFDPHDRILLSNFFMVDSGKGFNLIPFKTSNSQIICESIFNKYTYKRLKNHLKMISNYHKRLDNLSTLHFKKIGSR